MLSRRRFTALTATTIASVALGSSCRRFGGAVMPSDGRLSARPRSGVKTSAAGQIKLERDAVLQIPANAGDKPLPLLIMLHGATQRADDMFWYLDSAPDEAGVAVFAPNSADTTWDAIGGRAFGEDVYYLDRMLAHIFETTAIDPARISIGGFSDGATYALSLGLINGDFFKSIVAFSPGFVIGDDSHGKPRIFISHGTRDHILPIDRCGRRIAGELKGRGYDVTFREFDGDHEIPADVVRAGLSFV
ncbi:MAG TPA: PHB depolymerase family esterase [Pyrinomonadaceae bacterium]|nr:PHB depolymerase family esterase [Pyrinomonadaceae bacterium]